MKLNELLIAASLIVMSMGQAAAITYNFDGPVDTDITNDYPGLTFIAPGTGTGPVQTWATSVADSGGNVLGLTGQSNFYALNQSDGNAIDVIFATPLSAVSIRAAFVVSTELYTRFAGSLPFMAVYNSTVIGAANRIGLVSWDNPTDSCFNATSFCTSAYDTLDFNDAAGSIRAIRITGAAAPAGFPTRRAIFDTLVVTPVPEPASALLLSAGVAVLLGRSWVKARKA